METLRAQMHQSSVFRFSMGAVIDKEASDTTTQAEQTTALSGGDSVLMVMTMNISPLYSVLMVMTIESLP